MIRFVFIGVLVMLLAWKEDVRRTDQVYLPLSKGNHWEYADVSIEEHEITRVRWDIVGDSVIDDENYFMLHSDNMMRPKDVRYFRNEGTVVYEKRLNTLPELTFIPSMDSIGRSYLEMRDSSSTRITLISIDTNLKTPKNKYESLLCMKYEDLTKKITVFGYYKKGLGLVGVTNEKGEVVRYLTGYSLK